MHLADLLNTLLNTLHTYANMSFAELFGLLQQIGAIPAA